MRGDLLHLHACIVFLLLWSLKSLKIHSETIVRLELSSYAEAEKKPHTIYKNRPYQHHMSYKTVYDYVQLLKGGGRQIVLPGQSLANCLHLFPVFMLNLAAGSSHIFPLQM